MQTKAVWVKMYVPKELTVIFMKRKRMVLDRHPISSVHPTAVGPLR